MKKTFLFSLLALLAVSCTNQPKENATETTASAEPAAVDTNVKDKSFDELFKAIEPDSIQESVFKLVSKDNTVITSGKDTVFNSMVASDGGFGILMGKPVVWCCLRASRYTLEIIRKEKTFTFTYFDEAYRDQFMLFGQKSGRDSNKMKETTLTPVVTPSGRIAYKEAKLIIECDLAQTVQVNPDDCYSAKNKEFFEDAFKEVKGYHQFVYGDITNVWVRK